MPETIGSITVPCLTETVTLTTFSNLAQGSEAEIAASDVLATKARVRPACVVQGSGTPYTAGVATVPPFATVIFDNNGMFSLATPTIVTIQTAGTYVINFESSTNMASTNTSHLAEIQLNGVTIASNKGGTAITGNVPANPWDVYILAPTLVVGDQIRVRVTVTGVGNDNTFPLLSVALISYGV